MPGADVAGLGAPTPATDCARDTEGAVRHRGRAVRKPKPATTRAKPSASPSEPPPRADAHPYGETDSQARAQAPTKTPTPTPTRRRRSPPTPNGDFTGPSVTYKYGTLQIGIRVSDGRIVDAWAVTYPMGDSQPYSEMAVPILREQTIGATSADIAGATGASFTSLAWEKSLAGAIAKAGI